MGQERHPLSPRLTRCPEGLPRDAYVDAGWFGREMASVFSRQWVLAGRLADGLDGAVARRRCPDGDAHVASASSSGPDTR